MNRIVIFIIVIFIFLASITGVYIYFKQQRTPVSAVFNAVPIKSAMLIEVKNPDACIQKLNEGNKIWEQLSALNMDSDVKTLIHNVDTFVNENDQGFSWGNKKLLISVLETGKDKYSPLVLFKLKNRKESNKLMKAMEYYLSNKGVITEKEYNNVAVFQYKSNSNGVFYAAFHKGIFFISPNEMILQDGIRQVESKEGLLEIEEFRYLVETAGDNIDATIYLQFSYFKKLMNDVVIKDLSKDKGLSVFADWCALDMNLKHETVLLNGFAISQPKSYHYSRLFEGQQPSTLDFLKYTPASAVGFAAMSISDIELYRENLKYYMDATNQRDRFNINISQVKEVYGKESIDALYNIFDGEVAYMSMPDKNSYFIIKTKGYRDAVDYIKTCLKKYNTERDVPLEKLTHTYKLDNDSKFEIYEMPLKHFPTRIFGPWFNSCKAVYVTAYDDYLVYGNTLQSVKRFIYDNMLEKTYLFDNEYSSYENYLASRQNFYLFIPLGGNATGLKNSLNNKALKYISNNQKQVSDFYGFGWQFSYEDDKFYNNVVLHYQPTNQVKAGTEWESRLDTLVAMKPVLVKNHANNEKEIFVQDMKNTIYLVNKNGRIIWKKKLKSSILGDVRQIDYYKNGKLQLIFNTEDEMYILDRNGNNVEKYPLAFQSKAVAPLAVFDYDKRKNYRIFIPFEDRNVKAFSIDGKTITGFKFHADNDIISSVQHFRIGDKDYIVIADDSRLYFTDRQGKDRIKVKDQFEPSKNNKMEFQSGNGSRKDRFIRTSNSGVIKYIYMDGKVESKEIDDFSDQHFFAFQDITGDQVPDYIFVDKNELEVYSSTGERAFKMQFESEIIQEPAFYSFSAKKKSIGITDSDNQKIYMIDQRGDIMNGFPLPGKTRFSIGVLSPGSNRFNLIVGGDNQYLYNYRLN